MKEKYLKELEHLIKLSRIAVEGIDNNLRDITTGDFSRGIKRVWYHINGLLVCFERISRLLWGDAEKASTQERSKKLRSILNVPDNSLFNKDNRSISQKYDHIDEILDEIDSGASKLGNLDLNIGDINTMIGNKGPGDYMRHYDPNTKMIYFGNHKLSILDFIKEIKTLEDEVLKQLQIGK